MNATDLKRRGFQPLKAPGAHTYCAKCRRSSWFEWWRGPKFGITVASCETCGTVPESEIQYVRACPVIGRPLAVGE